MITLSCNNNWEEYGMKWSADIREKIIEDSGKTPDSISVEQISDTMQIITTFKEDTFLRRFRYNPISKDTVASIYFSGDFKFVLGKKYCSLLKDSYEESISYLDILSIGLHKFHYCNGNPKRIGLSFKEPVGTWKEFDSSGNVINIVDYGNAEQLKELGQIKYYR